MRRILTPERQQELVKDYLAGVYRTELSKKYDLFPTQIYAYLRKNGVQANRQRKPSLEYYCAVCGALRPMPPYSPNAIWRVMATCGDPACKGILYVRPDLRVRALLPYYRSGGKSKWKGTPWDDVWDINVRKEIVELDATELAALEYAFHLGVDERGLDLSERARKSLWGRLSQLSIAVHLRAEGPSDTALRLSRKQPLKEFLRMHFGKDVESAAVTADAFDVVYLWRCACPNQTSYAIKSLSEFPTETGEYGVCALCSAAALEIE